MTLLLGRDGLVDPFLSISSTLLIEAVKHVRAAAAGLRAAGSRSPEVRTTGPPCTIREMEGGLEPGHVRI